MANKGDIYKVALPNGDEYNFKDKYVRENYRALNNNDFDTINVTELNSGNIINTGAARFLNTINGSISGNAATATKATQDSDGSVINTTYVKKSGTTFTGRVAYNNISMPLSAGKVTSLAAGTTEIFKDGIAISNPATFYDVGWIRVTGTGESDTVLEIATGDDGGMTNCEKTVVRQYNTSNVVAREAVLLNTDGTSSFPVSVTSPKFIGALQGNADTATKFNSARTVALTGDTTGSTSADGSSGWSVATTTSKISGTAEAAPALVTSPGTGKIRYSYNVNNGTIGLFPTISNANSILTLSKHAGNFHSQLGFSDNGRLYYRSFSNTPLDNTTAWQKIFYDGDTYSGTLTSSQVTTALTYTPLNSSLKGAANGVAELDANGLVPSSQLPSYVDDVQEYTSKSAFPTTGETGKIYVAIDTNLTYRWSGSAYVEISPSLALGETSSTAYRGDRGATAYSHATDSSRLTTATASGFYKVASTAQGHIASLTTVTKADITALGIPSSDTTYSAGTGLSLSGTTFSVNNATISPYEAYLQWGGKNFAGSYGPIDAAMVPELGPNRLAFINGDAVTVEYTRDGGSTWIDYGATKAQKCALFSTVSGFVIGKADSTNKATTNGTNYQLRVTFNSSTGNVYTVLNKFVIYCSTNGSSSCSCKIQAATQGTPDTFWDVTGDVGIAGWSGYNVINVSGLTTYGNRSDQNIKVRFIFKANGGDTNYVGLTIAKIRGYGGVGWSTPSNMAASGSLFNYDEYQNATFPAQITATAFNGNATSATSATKATQDGDGNTISSTYVKVTGDPTIFKASDIAEGAANLSTQATAHRITVYRNGMTIPYQMDNANDGGMIRVRGTSESNCIFELGTWDDSGTGETIQFNYYPTTSQVTPTYSVTVPKATGTLSLTNQTISNITRSGTTFTATRADGTTFTFDQKDDDTKYGISASADNITLIAGGTGTTVQAHLCYNIAIGNTTDWNTFQNAGAYKVQMASWGDADTYHSPNKYKSDLYSFGMLYVVKSGVSGENRIFQYYIPHSTTMPLLVRSHNSSSWDAGWSAWYPIWVGISKSDVGLGNVENKSSATIRGEITSSNVTTALGYTPANSTSLANYLPLSGGTMTGQIVLASTGYKTNSTSGYVVDQYGNFKHQSTNTGEYWVISNNAGTAKFSVYWETGKVVAAGDVQSATTLCANTANSSTAGGLSLYGTDPTTYGVLFRGTGNQGKHGYVQSDWATYFTMSNTNNRGWVFRRQSSGNVASIDTSGQMVLNGSLTLGGNATNTSGVRQVYNSTTQSLDFVFVA